MRKLTVKNFSVIKEAELEFGKITVLIGPQSSGKSLLCKLAYFCEQIIPELVHSALLLRMSYDKVLELIAGDFEEKFPRRAWGNQLFQVAFRSPKSYTTIRRVSKSMPLRVRFDEEFKPKYEEWIGLHQAEGSAKGFINSLRNGTLKEDSFIEFGNSAYIPTGRSFFSTPNRGYSALSTKNLDWITQRFAPEPNWDYDALIASSKNFNDMLSKFGDQAKAILGGQIVKESGNLLFESTTNHPTLPLELLSSGTLELLPLLNPLSEMVKISGTNDSDATTPKEYSFGPIFIEEPELGIFPETQYLLARLFSWLVNQPQMDISFVITTHSPYLMTAFNTLIEAGRVGSKAGKRDKTIEVVPEEYWIGESNFKAFALVAGQSVSIFKTEADNPEGQGMIDGDYLDGVSDQLGREFDRLLDIEYAS